MRQRLSASQLVVGDSDKQETEDRGKSLWPGWPARRIAIFLLVPVLATMASFTAWCQVVVPFGYLIEPVVATGLNRPTAMARDNAGRLYVTQHGPGGVSGAVKVIFPGPPPLVWNYATVPQLEDPAGIVVDGTRVVVSNRAPGVLGQGQIIEYIDWNGNFIIDTTSELRIVISDLPQGVNGTRALVRGPGGLFYVGQGSITNSSSTEPIGINTDVFSFDLPEPFIRLAFASGFYNPLGIAFDPDGRAFVTDRSPAQETAPDELNFAEEGDFFGFGKGGLVSKPPLVAFPHFSSPAGVAYFSPSDFTAGKEVVYVALEGHPAGLDEPPPKVVEVTLHRQGDQITTDVNDFVVGLDRPFGLLRVDLGGGAEQLLISDFEANAIYRVRLRTDQDPPDRDIDRSGRVDSGDIYMLIQERIQLLEQGPPQPPDFLKADFNGDDQIDHLDLFILAAGWQGDGPE